MSNQMTIQSQRGPYSVQFDEFALSKLNANLPENAHYIIDENVAKLYAREMDHVLSSPSVLVLEATEEAKSLEHFPKYVAHLIGHQMRRDHVLVAIGGGIIQDITCFLAATMMRGVRWILYPTTLLAQADSCIGSKSSINAGNAKNILGTFTPPNEVFISTSFLKTLNERDVRSGVGEILKVHAIDGPSSFAKLAEDYLTLFSDQKLMELYIRRALEIKKGYIEEDEFDRGVRNLFNYGHSFGHALEAATEFSIPHGIAVTMGMDMANYSATQLGVGSATNFDRMHATLKANYIGYENIPVPLDSFLTAISKDKKNVGSGEVTIIIPDSSGKIHKSRHANDEKFSRICADYLETARSQ